MSHSKNVLQLQLIRCDTSVDADAPNQSLTFNVMGPYGTQDLDNGGTVAPWTIVIVTVTSPKNGP